MFEVYPWFQWFLVQRTRLDGSTWYVSHVHKDGTYTWTRDPLYARHFTGRMANIHVHWLRSMLSMRIYREA